MRCLLLLLSFAFVAGAADAGADRKPARAPVAAKKQGASAKKEGATHKARKPRKAKRSHQKPPPPAVAKPELELRWQELQLALKPAAVVKLCEDFEKDFPRSERGPAIKEIQAAAQGALQAQRVARLSSDALEEDGGDAGYRAQLGKALRGDKEAAYRIAAMYGDGSNGLPRHPRRHEQWLQFAAELGHGSASWQLAELLNLAGQWSEAAKYEQRSFEQGFQPSSRLPTKARNY